MAVTQRGEEGKMGSCFMGIETLSCQMKRMLEMSCKWIQLHVSSLSCTLKNSALWWQSQSKGPHPRPECLSAIPMREYLNQGWSQEPEHPSPVSFSVSFLQTPANTVHDGQQGFGSCHLSSQPLTPTGLAFGEWTHRWELTFSLLLSLSFSLAQINIFRKYSIWYVLCYMYFAQMFFDFLSWRYLA